MKYYEENKHSAFGVKCGRRLADAASDLLAACKAMVASGRTPRDTDEFRAVVAAIAKAEGKL